MSGHGLEFPAGRGWFGLVVGWFLGSGKKAGLNRRLKGMRHVGHGDYHGWLIPILGKLPLWRTFCEFKYHMICSQV
jgi:hypothetical protein